MRKIIVSAGALLCLGLMACATLVSQDARASSMSWRFIGLEALKGKTNLIVLHEVIGLTEFEGFRSNLTERVADTLAKHASHESANQAELAKLLRPLAGDLINYQTIFSQEGEGKSNVCTLAIQLPPARHEIWKSNWNPILKSMNVPGATLRREGQWTLVSNGSVEKQIQQTRRSSTSILEFEGDAGFLNAIVPIFGNAKGNLKVMARGAALRSEGTLHFEKDLNLNLKPWEIPTNTIREPLVGFTAAQGISHEMAKLPGFKKHRAPNQAFFWGEGMAPISISMAFKVDEPKQFVRDFAEEAAATGKIKIGNLTFNTNSHRFLINNLPLATPFLAEAHTNDAKFVYGGLFPVADFPNNPMPAELANELSSRTNLVYYDWELGFARTEQWPLLFQLIPMAMGEPIPFYQSAAHRWLQAAKKKLGNTVTEISQTGTRELSLVRRSDLGLSSIELFRLVEWISGPPSPDSALIPLPGATSKP